jgi:hypothetical protein
MTFDQIEKVVGAALPPSSRFHRAWWSSNASNSAMTAAWRAAGFRSTRVDMAGGKLIFQREGTAPAPTAANRARAEKRYGGRKSGKHSLYGWLEGTVRVAPGVDLTEPADPDWGKRAYE